MPTPQKNEIIAELTELLKSTPGVFLTDYSGLNAEVMTDLRKRCYEANVNFRVVKNTLARKAAEAAGMPEMSEHFTDSTAIAYADDPSQPIKLLQKFTKDVREAEGKPEVRTGMVDGKLLDAAEMDFLAKMDSPEIVKAKFLGLLQAPASNFVGLISAVPSSLVRAMDQRRQKLEDNENSAG
jgi:large subunit ribosomal protein L10